MVELPMLSIKRLKSSLTKSSYRSRPVKGGKGNIMKRFLFVILLVMMIAGMFGCETIPECDRNDGEVSGLEAGYIIMAVSDVFIVGLTLYGMSTVGDALPRANPNDPGYVGE